jgi:hypothetical protein
VTAFDGWTKAMLKRRVNALGEFDQIWIDSLQREIDALKTERSALFRLDIAGSVP